MKILCLVTWQPNGRWLWDFLPDNQAEIDYAYITHPTDRFAGYGKFLNYYPKFFGLGLKAYPRMKEYDVIVTWEANTALPLAFFRSVTGIKTPPMLVLNFVLKNKPVMDNLWFTKFALRSIDRITVLSSREINYYSKILDYPKERFIKLQGPYVDPNTGYMDQVHSGDYIFAAGRSHRDYATLIEAVRGLPIKVVINARSFNVKGLKPPENVTINPFLPYSDFLTMLRGARFVVLPLFAAKHASGETFLIQAMTAEKTVIASDTYSIGEMIDSGQNGLLVPPGDVTALRKAIIYLLDHPAEAENMGKLARRNYFERWSFPVVARQVHNIVAALVGST